MNIENEPIGQKGPRKDVALPRDLVRQPLEGSRPYAGVTNWIKHGYVSRQRHRCLHGRDAGCPAPPRNPVKPFPL